MTLAEKRICDFIQSRYPDDYYPTQLLPKPYHGKGPIKAIIVGADPTFKKNNGQYRVVFGLDKETNEENEKSPFFKSVMQNLKCLGYSLDNIYVQNLARNYFKEETSKNKVWTEYALLWRDELKKDLDGKFSPDIPVLVTAEIILKVLVHKNELKKTTAGKIYSEQLSFTSDQNYLKRPLYAFYRHYKYKLENQTDYKNYLLMRLH